MAERVLHPYGKTLWMDKTYVEYALKQSNAPIGVATYQLQNTLPEEMRSMLPDPEEIVKRLSIFKGGNDE